MVQHMAMAIPSISMDRSSLDSASVTSETITESSALSSYSEIPLTALSRNTKRKLSNLLNCKKILRSEEGYERDWRGIAALAQQKNTFDENSVISDDPMAKVLQLWCTNNPKTATFGNLEHFLGIIDRWDVSDDIYENFVEDAKNYNAKPNPKSAYVNDQNDALNSCSLSNKSDDFGLGSDPNILTKDDVLRAQKGLPPQKYDAFVLFADADIQYAVEMLTKLEDNPELSFKLCLKDRDLLAGVSFAHVALTQLIEERCKHLIVILTEEFLKSPENKFLVNYTQALQIQSKTRKIIPLLYEDSVVIPRTLRIYTHLKYNSNASSHPSSLFNFWSKLAASIRNVNIAVESPTPVYTKDIYNCSTKRSFEVQKQPNLANLPSPPLEIPSINLNGHAITPEDEVPKKRTLFKRRGNDSKTLPLNLTHAHSTSQLNQRYREIDSSLSNLSTGSGCSDTKKKKKWTGKFIKRMFSRSTSKLQETA